MSVLELIITDRTREDFEDIITYTAKQWGHDQADEYASRINAALMNLWHFPKLGRIRFDIASDVRSIPVGQHVIYYHPTEDAIIIRRIVHGRRDVHVDLDE